MDWRGIAWQSVIKGGDVMVRGLREKHTAFGGWAKRTDAHQAMILVGTP